MLGVLTAKTDQTWKSCKLAKNKKCSFRLPKLENHRVVHMIVGVVESLVTLTNARHWYNLDGLENVIWTKCRGFWQLQIRIQSCKFTNHRVVPMILWVVASMVTLTNARCWYNLVWLKSVIWTKMGDLCLVYRYGNHGGSACDWVVPATLYVTAPNCQVHKMAQPNSTSLRYSVNLNYTTWRQISQIPEFGPVT